MPVINNNRKCSCGNWMARIYECPYCGETKIPTSCLLCDDYFCEKHTTYGKRNCPGETYLTEYDAQLLMKDNLAGLLKEINGEWAYVTSN